MKAFFLTCLLLYTKITGACNYNINPEKTKKPKMFWCSGVPRGVKWEHCTERG